ncbi:enoyl-CoA hydratase/isomerase family protein [Robiginitomaculum antarcticum]|uniref:enoyl-CoA hydratase/isomerase family protein n=1 Tax=Robiginitomaculum antarcticum TaxID=437507 RepID=UPI00037D3C06|nr:enoyl-CoA hydratase/isomerase family protein [Robiginitomaculum antarcticum]
MTNEIISRVSGNLGHITLNRPKALNALTQNMCDVMTELLTSWEADPAIGAVLIDGAGDRAFCAGGDVILLHDSGKAGDGRAEQFWRTEYALNELIHRYSKPYITLIDGFVMGGGVGLSVHGGHRIAGDNTQFAMPETGIGYFPDVGGTYFLPRLGMAAGQWLGMTGARLGAGDCLALGIANDFINSDKHAAFTEALGKAKLDGSEDAVIAVIAKFGSPGPMAAPLPAALNAFEEDSPAAILRALDAMDGEWAAKQAVNLRRKSPMAISITHEAIKRGADLDFKAAMSSELDISLGFLKTQDFYEGIRAQLIDKDRKPKWQHDSLGDVTSEQIEQVFRPTSQPLQFL